MWCLKETKYAGQDQKNTFMDEASFNCLDVAPIQTLNIFRRIRIFIRVTCSFLSNWFDA